MNPCQAVVSRTLTVLRHFIRQSGALQRIHAGAIGDCAWGCWDDEPRPRVVGVGSTIGDTTGKSINVGTRGDNEYRGGPALSALSAYARNKCP